ncbi:Ger(x)C family spore germination protein [Ureibacillus composti]
MKKPSLIILIFCCTVLLIGCSEERILERLSLPTLIGYDVNEENTEITTTAVIRQVSPEFESRIEIQSATAKTSKGTRIDTNLKTSRKLLAGQLRVILLSETLAKNGIEGALHTTMMNSEISTSVYLAVVEGDTKDLIEYQYPSIKDIGQHVFSLIDQNVEERLTISSTVHEVARDQYSPYKNTVIPIIKRQDESIMIKDVGLFHNGKLAGKLPSKDVFYILLARRDVKHGTLELLLPQDGFDIDDSKQELQIDKLPIAIDSLESKRSIKIVNADTPEFDITIKADCRLLEIHRSVEISKMEDLKKIEKAVNKEIKKELERVIKYGQEVGSDVFGFGDYYFTHTRNPHITEEEWAEKFKNMKVNIKTDIRVLRNGVFE